MKPTTITETTDPVFESLTLADCPLGGVRSVGASFTLLMVIEKSCVPVLSPPFAVPPLSVTVTVNVAVPKAFAVGVKVRLPLVSIAGSVAIISVPLILATA